MQKAVSSKTAYFALYANTYADLTVDAVFYDYNDYYNNCDSVAINANVKLINSTDDHPAGVYKVIDKKILQYISNAEYDSEDNPILEKIALKWGREDLSLKLSLLSQFFSTFFMPIHTSILHAAVEDKIYTNTIKLIEGNTLCRTDNFGDWNYIECNIKNCIENVNLYFNSDKDSLPKISESIKDEILENINSFTEDVSNQCGFVNLHLVNEQKEDDFLHGRYLKSSHFADKIDFIKQNENCAVFSSAGEFLGLIEKDAQNKFKYKFVIN